MTEETTRTVSLDAGVNRGNVILMAVLLVTMQPVAFVLSAGLFYVGTAAGLTITVPLALVTGWLAVLIVGQFRYAAWLEGSTLAHQKALRVQRCDLAHANVLLGTPQGRYGEIYRATYGPAAGVNSLTAWVPGRRKKLVIRLATGNNRPIPGRQLAALADAIETKKDSPIPRSEELADKAVVTLRECAAA